MVDEELEVRVYRLARDLPTSVEVVEAPDNTVAVIVSEVSWKPQGPMTFEAWADAGQRLQFMARSINWLIGDWIAYGEHHFGEKYAQAIDITGLEHQTLMNIVSVAKLVPPERRREALSWSHHQAIANVKADEQDEWLDRAEQEGMTVARLRSRLQGTPKDAPDPDQQISPTHMGQIRFKFVAESGDAAHARVKELATFLERKGVSVVHKQAGEL